VAYIGQFKI